MSTSTTLLRTEAIERARVLDVATVHVELRLGADDFTSRSTITFSCAEPGASTFVDFQGTALDEVVLNGTRLEPSWEQGRIALAGLQAHNDLVVSGRMAYSSDGEGLHRHVDAADGATYLYAMSFLDAAPRWFACFDQPDLKASYTFDVTCPTDWIVRGNTRATQVSPGHWELGASKPLSTYFVTLAAGPWHELTDEWRPTDPRDGGAEPVHLGLLARRSLAAELDRDAADIFHVTQACLAEYHRLFRVAYPFGDYLQVFAPDFNAGAMENPGCVVFRDQFLPRGEVTEAERASRAGVIAHEMAHQWFGDLVTMRWWDDLWLNESFAEYMGHRVCTDAAGYELWTEFGTRRKAWGFAADEAPSTHPVAGNGAADARAALANFDGISYAKGASVLRQLATWLGDERFLTGLRRHFADHAFGNATRDDLMAAWRVQGADGLDAWADRWLSTTGVDLLRVTDDGAALLREGSRPHTITVDVTGPDGATASQQVAVDAEHIDLAGAPAGHLVLPDADDAAWARVRPALPGGSWWRFPPTALERTSARVVWTSALRDAVRCGELAPAAALDAVLAALPNEPHPLLLQAQIALARELATLWSRPARRAEREQRLAGTLLDLLHDAQGDRQLVALRNLVSTSSDTGLLRELLAGGTERPLGPDERWNAVARLVSLGEPVALVDEELARDPSSSAQVAAARCRASVPTAEAKQAALAVVLEPGEPSAYLASATAGGIFLPGQHELTAPLVAAWFDGIAQTAAFRQGWALRSVLRAGFPSSHADPETLARADDLLARDDLDPAVRRELTDATDDLRRQVTALERYEQ